MILVHENQQVEYVPCSPHAKVYSRLNPCIPVSVELVQKLPPWFSYLNFWFSRKRNKKKRKMFVVSFFFHLIELSFMLSFHHIFLQTWAWFWNLPAAAFMNSSAACPFQSQTSHSARGLHPLYVNVMDYVGLYCPNRLLIYLFRWCL